MVQPIAAEEAGHDGAGVVDRQDDLALPAHRVDRPKHRGVVDAEVGVDDSGSRAYLSCQAQTFEQRIPGVGDDGQHLDAWGRRLAAKDGDHAFAVVEDSAE